MTSSFHEYIALLDDVQNTHFPSGYMSPNDRQYYSDLRAVFVNGGATQAQAHRVLAVLCAEAGIMGNLLQYEMGAPAAPGQPPTIGGSVDASATMAQVGKADLMAKLLRAMSVDPVSSTPPADSYAADDANEMEG